MANISWTNSTRRIGDLIPWADNPRYLDEDDYDFLERSLETFGYAEPILIGPNNEVYNGHQRLTLLLDKFGPDHVEDVRVSSRPLSLDERKRLTVFFHESAVGQWDYEKLFAKYTKEELIGFGFPEWKLPDPDEVMSLEELQEKYGEYDETDFWPIIRVKVPPATYSEWAELMQLLEGEDEADKVDALIKAANATLL